MLFGDYNPAGRLPVTFPRGVGQLPMFYNYKPSARKNITAVYADGTSRYASTPPLVCVAAQAPPALIRS